MRILGTLLITVLSLVLVPLGVPAHAAATATVTGIALGPGGKPLPNVYWDIHVLEGGKWTSPLMFGPKVTDAMGRFTYEMPLHGQYRVCFQDSYYGQTSSQSEYWQPEVRHRDACWPNASAVESAQTWTPTASNSTKTFTVKMAEQGMGMAPVDPFIVGTYELGQPLTIVGQEGWRPTNATFSYQWLSQTDGAESVPIPGATSATFVPTAAQSGKWVYARVTASRPGYKPATLWTPISKAGGNHVKLTSPLKITGQAKPGSTLTASFGKPPNTASEIRWFVDGVPHPEQPEWDAPTSRFSVTEAHAGARIDARMKIYRTDERGYIDGTDTFQRVQAQVAGKRPTQSLPAAPAPKGEAAVGRVLKAPTDVTADPKAKVSYQWMRGSKAIKGATKSRYKIKKADLNKKVKVRVTVTRPGWWGKYVTTSKATLAKRALKKGKVTIAGKARVGKKLTVRTPGWGPKPVKVRRQWLRNGKAIKGATKIRYKVKKSDRGKSLKVRVTVKKSRHATVTRTSKGLKVKR